MLLGPRVGGGGRSGLEHAVGYDGVVTQLSGGATRQGDLNAAVADDAGRGGGLLRA